MRPSPMPWAAITSQSAALRNPALIHPLLRPDGKGITREITLCRRAFDSSESST